MTRRATRHWRTLALTLAVLGCLAWLAPADATARGGPDIEDRDVEGTDEVIFGHTFYAMVPGRGEGNTNILISTHHPGEMGRRGRRKRGEAMSQAEFDALLDEAKTWREAKLRLREQVGWNSKMYFVKTEHFELGYDIPSIKLLGRQQADVREGMLEYARRLELLWSDWEDAFGPLSHADFSAPLTMYMHDKMEDCVLTAQKILKKELRPGPTRGLMKPSCNYWDRQTMPTDNDLWENVCHFIAGQMASQFRGTGRQRMSIPAWLDEGLAYYFTRIHREMDTHTTIIFEEQIYERAEHIDGSQWKGHSKKVADGMKDEEIKAIFGKSKSNLTQDERILGWAIICYMIEYSKERTEAILKGLESDRSKDVDLEEWMADPRHDTNGDLEVSEEEKAEAEREFEEWDLDDNGTISIEDEAKAHMFREYLQLQKTRFGGLEHEDALQRAFGWTNQDMLDRVRAWLNGRPFIDRKNVDWALFTDWRKYSKRLEDFVEENIDDEMKCARALMSLGRWKTEDAVLMLYEILEFYEKLLDRGDIQRPIKIYEAARAIVGRYSDTTQLRALFDCVIDGKIGRKGADDVVVRNTLVRGLATNKAGGNINNNLARGLRCEEYSIRVSCLDVLKERGVALGADSVTDDVVKCLDDSNRAVRIAAAQCLTRLANRSDQRKFLSVLDALVARMEKENGDVFGAIYEALKDITGDDVGPSYNRWSDWARLYRVAVNRGERSPRPQVANPPADPHGTGVRENTPDFGGDPIYAKRIVFVLDRSHSMTERLENKQAVITGTRKKRRQRAETTGGGSESGHDDPADEDEEDPIDWSKVQTKWDLAREALIATLNQMAEEHKGIDGPVTGAKHTEVPERYFTVVLYDHRVWVWSEVMVPANRTNVDKAIDWVRNQPDPNSSDEDEKWGLTNIYDAIAAALEITTGERMEASGDKPKGGAVLTDTGEEEMELSEKGAEEIRLLTDGRPTDGSYVNAGDLLNNVRELNRSRKVRINTYGLGQHDKEICGKLAEQNNGKYEDWTYDSGIK